jgi:hypothetical protein
MRKKVILLLLTASLAMSATACGKKKETSSSSGLRTSTASFMDSGSQNQGSLASSSGESSENSSASISSPTGDDSNAISSSGNSGTEAPAKTYTPASEITDAELEAMNQAIEYVYTTAEVGTAGSSLKCADAAGYLLEWSESNSVDPETIKQQAYDYITGNYDDAADFKKQMDATYEQVLVLAKGDDNAKGLLTDAGMDQAYDFPWNNKDLDVIKAIKDAADEAE